VLHHRLDSMIRETWFTASAVCASVVPGTISIRTEE
jgi:hypothetical protein